MEKQELTFIKSIKIPELRHHRDLQINVHESELRHLIITGRNGSGKTSLLERIWGDITPYQETLTSGPSLVEMNGALLRGSTLRLGNPEITWFFPADRVTKQDKVESIQSLTHEGSGKRSQKFIQHLVNLKAERSFARDEGDQKTADSIDSWFHHFEQQLGLLYGEHRLKLEFVREPEYKFLVHLPERPPFGLNQLSRGYSAIIEILAELILRSPEPKSRVYDSVGIVLIDEIETHLHIKLQKQILPFLSAFFPRIQFVVTTHSPFVLTSVENAVVFDLETREHVTDLWLHSSEALVESYFGMDKYSAPLKKKVAEYEELLLGDGPRDEARLTEIRNQLDTIPRSAAPELFAKVQQLELDALVK